MSHNENLGDHLGGDAIQIDDGFMQLLERNNFTKQRQHREFCPKEARQRLFKASRTGNLKLMKNTL